MRRMFFAADVFNQDLSNWNVSGVINMESMFYSADVFNQDLSNWNVSNVTNMDDMFASANTLSNVHKGLIHSAFSSNPNWTTDWSTLVPAPASLTNANFQTAVNLWCTDKTAAFTTYGYIKDWNVTGVTNMEEAFKDRATFNDDISGWDVSNVTGMTRMFDKASDFNQSIGNWNVSSVTQMNFLFHKATAFNRPIGDWNTSSVTNVAHMFYDATAFNQPIGDWNVSSATNMANMFRGATSFNQPIGNWDMRNVWNAGNMFKDATSFNQPIGNWNLISLTNMNEMFRGATSFNQDIGNWNVSGVQGMWRTFQNASTFNQSIENWNVSNLKTVTSLFEQANSFDQDLSDWNVSAVTNMDSMFNGTTSLSNTNKGKIHTTFSTNSNWPYDWSAYVAIPPTDNNQTAPPVDQNSSAPPVDYNGTHPPVDGNNTQTDQNVTAPTPVDFNSTLFRPLLQTLDREELGADSIRLWGMILADGESPVTEVAFEVADNLVFRNSTLHPASMLEGSPNFYAFIILEPGKRYYYRAVATNGMGATYGLTKRFTTPASEANWWTNEPEIPGGWRHSSWLGAFQPYETGWIYHAKLGWAYAQSDGSGGLWLWMRDHRWTWTQQGVFPYLWKHQSASWHYLLGTQNGQSVFYEWKQSASEALP